MKAGLTVLLFLILTFSLAASENVEITGQVRAAADKYVCEKFIITKAGVWQKIEYTQGVKRRYFKKDEKKIKV